MSCGDGSCIDESFRCDGFKDCKNGEDEVGCRKLISNNCNYFNLNLFLIIAYEYFLNIFQYTQDFYFFF